MQFPPQLEVSEKKQNARVVECLSPHREFLVNRRIVDHSPSTCQNQGVVGGYLASSVVEESVSRRVGNRMNRGQTNGREAGSISPVFTSRSLKYETLDLNVEKGRKPQQAGRAWFPLRSCDPGWCLRSICSSPKEHARQASIPEQMTSLKIS
jgi:hypothetical protein